MFMLPNLPMRSSTQHQDFGQAMLERACAASSEEVLSALWHDES